MGKPHVIMLPFPMQGHVIPLMEFGQFLAKQGIRITFFILETIHQSIIKAYPERNNNAAEEQIRLVSIPSVNNGEDMVGRLHRNIKEFIVEINGSNEDKITCIVYDHIFGTTGEMAKDMAIGSVAFSTASAAYLLLGFNIPKLIQDGIIDTDGSPLKNQTLQFDPTNPEIKTTELQWTTVKHLPTQKSLFNNFIENTNLAKSADWVLCNSVYDLEPGAFSSIPHVTPIGPLLANSGISAGHFLEQDYTCLKWLDEQKANSVIYVAFGTSMIMNVSQFQELALGLELTNAPFLWAVRPEKVTSVEADQAFPDGFLDRVSGRGLIIGWAPQQKVLNHPSVACFVSHCGWNSTMESVNSGVPLLCWPYFAEQFMNKSYICDIWKVGLGLEENDSAIITSEEIKNKVEKLVDEGEYKERALQVKEIIESSAREGGNTHKNLTDFIKWLQTRS